MALADTIVALVGGSVIDRGTPGTLLNEGGCINRLGIKFTSDDNKEEEEENGRRIEQTEEALPSDSARSDEIARDPITDLTDMRRKNGDPSVYKDYFSNAGYYVVVLYVVFIVLMMFCAEFPGLSYLPNL